LPNAALDHELLGLPNEITVIFYKIADLTHGNFVFNIMRFIKLNFKSSIRNYFLKIQNV